MRPPNVKLPTWKDVAHFFEKGDLTPLAVVISVAHYGPVLMRHNDNMLVAWMVGALIDLLHFRTVRRLFQVRGRQAIIGHALVAMLTTAMALGYHLRFYEFDWLLALPIPIGIGILAQHAAAKVKDDTLAKWRKRVKFVLDIARKLKADVLKFETRVKVLEEHVVTLQGEAQERKEAEAKLKEEMKTRLLLESEVNQTGKRMQELERLLETQGREIETLKLRGRAVNGLNPLVIDIGLMLAGEPLTQKDIATKHNVTEVEVSRLKARLNGVVEHA